MNPQKTNNNNSPPQQQEEGNSLISPSSSPNKEESSSPTSFARYFGYARPFVKNFRPFSELATKSTQKIFVSPRALGGKVGKFLFTKVMPKESKFASKIVTRTSASRFAERFFFKSTTIKTMSARIAPRLAHYFPEVYKTVAHAAIDVKGSYFMTALYVFGDTTYAVWCAHKENVKEEKEDSQKVVSESSGQHHHRHSLIKLTAEKLTFHFAATLVLPVMLLDGVAHYSAHYVFPKIWKPSASFRNAHINKFGPSMLSLSLIPFLPFIIDEPVEYVVKKIF